MFAGFDLKIETRYVPTDMLLFTNFPVRINYFPLNAPTKKSFGYNYIYIVTYVGDYKRGLD